MIRQPQWQKTCVWFISNGVGSEGVGLCPFLLPGICGRSAKQMSLPWDRARTPYQGKAAFAHLGLNSIILLETVKEQSQSPPPGMQLRCSMSSSPAAASRHAAPQSAWYQLSSAIVQPSKAQSCPCANTLLSKKRICTRP